MKHIALASCLWLWLAGAAPADSLYVRIVGHQSSYFYGSDVAVQGKYAYVVSMSPTQGLHIISVADPRRPQAVGYCGSVGSASGVAVAGSFAYVADGDSSSLRVVSIADPTCPVLVGSCSTPGNPEKVVISGQCAYVATKSGFCVISIADPTRPVQVAYLPGGFQYNLDVCGDYAYVADVDFGLRIISIADPANPTQVGLFNSCQQPQGVAVSGGLAYVGCNDDSSFRVISVRDPAHPVEVSCIGSDLCYATQAISIARGYAFVATMYHGLNVMSIADSAHVAEVAFYGIGATWSMVYGGGYEFVTATSGLYILQFYQLGDLDIAPDSLDATADTVRLQRWTTSPGDSNERASGEFVLANTSTSYNPDPSDGPSRSPVDSISFIGSLARPGGSIDGITIASLPHSLAQGQTVVCSLSAYIPVGLRDGDYTGTIIISGKDTAGLLVQDSCYVVVSKLGDIDVDNDSLDAVADTVRVRPRLVSAGPPPEYSDYSYGQFILVNTTESYDPDTTDGPSRSTVRSLQCSGVLNGPHGIIDSILIPNLPESLAIGQAVVCTLAVYVPPGLRGGDYSGPVVIHSDSFQPQIAETVYARVSKLGDLAVDGDSLDLGHDTMNLRAQPAGPIYHPFAKAEFMLVNTSNSYNPDTAGGPSRSPLQGFRAAARVEAEDSGSQASISVLNLPTELAVGQAVECTLALSLPVHVPASGYSGWVVVSAVDTAGYDVQDSFFLRVRGPEPRGSLDSLRVAPIPFKPHQNPEHDAIHFQGLSAKARVTVYDASGQSVWSATETGDGHLAWKAEVASGIYVYLVVSADGKSSKVGKLSVIR